MPSNHNTQPAQFLASSQAFNTQPETGDINANRDNHSFQFDLNELPEEATTKPETGLPEGGHHKDKRKRLSTEERMAILCWLLSRVKDGKLARGAINEAVIHFNISRRAIGTIWNLAKQQSNRNQRYNLTPKYSNSGRKRLQISPEDITSIQMGERSCIRDLAVKLNISKSATHRLIKRGVIRAHTNPLHPGLKQENKYTRLEWVLSLIHGSTMETKKDFHPMYDFVHLDEKWFYLSKKTQRVYLASNEKGKYRSASSSKFIPKVMFTAAVARPRFNAQGECTFDGKIGIFPFTYKEPAKRSSKNRGKGTIVTKLIDYVNQKVTRSMLINQIVPAIMEKWPRDGHHKTIYIQQDNAKAHINESDPEWQQVYQQEGFTFILVQQPPNSPDLNILDLGFFRSIQSLMHKKMPKHVDDMLEAVLLAFFELDPKTLGNVWYSLQYVMVEILKSNGGNEFDLPHVNKAKLARLGLLPQIVQAPEAAIRNAYNVLQRRTAAGQEGTSNEANEDIHDDTEGQTQEGIEDIHDIF